MIERKDVAGLVSLKNLHEARKNSNPNAEYDHIRHGYDLSIPTKEWVADYSNSNMIETWNSNMFFVGLTHIKLDVRERIGL